MAPNSAIAATVSMAAAPSIANAAPTPATSAPSVSAGPMQAAPKQLTPEQKRLVSLKFTQVIAMMPSIVSAMQLINSNPQVDKRGVGKRLVAIV